MSMQGQNIEFRSVKAQGGKEANIVKVAGQVVQKQIFDGKQGYSEQMGQKVTMTEEEIGKKLKNTELFEELGFSKSADYKLAGIEKINEEDSYIIKNGDKTYYYSVKTGLKTGESQKIKAQGQEITIPTTFSNYKEVNGVKLPHTITINQMGMDMVMNVKSYELNQAKDSDFK